MALSTAEKAQLFEIFGIPQSGEGYEVGRITSLFGPAAEAYDFSAIVTEINSILTTLDADASRLARVQALLTEWGNITSYSETEVYASGAARGILAHDEKRRGNIRDALSNLLGLYVPEGGFLGELRSRDHRILR